MKGLSFREAIDFLCKEYGVQSPYPPKRERELFDQNSHAIQVAFVEAVMDEYSFATPSDTGDIFWYDGGVYKEDGETKIREWVEKMHTENGISAKAHFVFEVVEAVKRRTYIPRDKMDSKQYLNLKNGLLNLETLDFIPHSTDVYSISQLPIEYKPEAVCPNMEKFVGEVMAPENVELIQEIIGYTLHPDNEYQKAFIFVGNGCNGKSVMLNLITALLGKRCVSSESLQDLCSSRFSSSSLYGKQANICADIPTKALPNTGVFKMLTGGDQIRFERKFKNPFYGVNRAKLLFSCNRMPLVNDDTLAFWRRWVIIPFPNSFGGKENPHLLQELCQELPGILNYAINGLKMLRGNSGFKNEATSNIKEEWEFSANPVKSFVRGRVEIDPEAIITKEEMYNTYREFCSQNDFSPVAQNVFAQRLRQNITTRAVQRNVDGGKRRWCWEGIAIKEENGESNGDLSPILVELRHIFEDNPGCSVMEFGGMVSERYPDFSQKDIESVYALLGSEQNKIEDWEEDDANGG